VAAADDDRVVLFRHAGEYTGPNLAGIVLPLPTYNDHHTMAVKIRVPGALRQLTRGAAVVEVNAGDVSQALDELNQKFPGFKERLYDDKGELRQFINIYRNDEDIRFGSGLKTPLKDSDDLSIVPAVAGG
jgi:MoaD family protein